jgi:hypothetical protein
MNGPFAAVTSAELVALLREMGRRELVVQCGACGADRGTGSER